MTPEPHIYDGAYGGDACGYCKFIDGAWRNRITYLGNDTLFSGETGIDCFAQVCRHEEQHRQDLTAFWGNNDVVAGRDLDNDGIPDDKEAELGYNPKKIATYDDNWLYGAGWCDIEHYCITRCYDWPDGNADTQDWSANGRQYQ